LNRSAQKYNLIVVLGPTASGKTNFAAELAARIDGEIVSADSRQVYRHMNLGTGKDYGDYLIDGKKIPYHLIDIKEPGYKYNVYEYQRDFTHAYQDITGRKRMPILCGGTGLYIEAVTRSYKLISVPKNEKLRQDLAGKSLEELETILSAYKKLHNKTDTDTIPRALRAIEIEEFYSHHPEIDPSFPPINPVFFGMQCERSIRRKRITDRLNQRLQAGMIDEVKTLIDMGINPQDLIYYGLEYKYITRYLLGDLTYNNMIKDLNVAIHQFAKRQMTWFRKMEREGDTIYWIDTQLPMDKKMKLALSYLKEFHR